LNAPDIYADIAARYAKSLKQSIEKTFDNIYADMAKNGYTGEQK
jgi:hypothetical protein